MALVSAIYKATATFPRDELFGLTSQLRRAAVSIPSNIAEGQSRYSRPEFRHFLRTAKGSLAELETQLLIAKDLGYLDESTCLKLLDSVAELGRIVSGLITSIEDQAAGAGAN
jgi:four helix bundle protein